MNGCAQLGRVSPYIEQLCAADDTPTVKARSLCNLAAWCREMTTQWANPAMWGACLRTAEHLEAQARPFDESHDG
jgi:hypothetical protein